MVESILGLMIPIIAIVLGLSIPILTSILEYRKRRRLIETHHAERMAAIERGMELPPFPADVLGAVRKRAPSSALLPGLIWLFVGIGLLLSLGKLIGDDITRFGFIPAGIGVAYLIYYAIEGRKLERPGNGPNQNGTDSRQA